MVAPTSAQPLCFSGSDHSVLGGAQLTLGASGSSLSVANIGSSGLDGVTVDHDHAKAFFMNWASLGSAASTQDGAEITVTANGIYRNFGCGIVGTTDITDIGSMLAIRADLTIVGSPTKRIDVYDNGQLQTSVSGATGVLALVAQWPTGCSKQLEDISPASVTGFWLRWSRSVTITIPNVGSFSGDELAVLTESPYSPTTSLQSLALQANGLNSVTITSERVLRESGAPGVLGMPNGLQLDVQSIVAQATGVSYGDMLGVEVDNAGHYYISARRATPTSPHVLVEIDELGNYVATYPLPPSTAMSPWGSRDLAFDGQYIYGGMEKSAGSVWAFNSVTKVFHASQAIPMGNLPNGIRGLGFVPDKPGVPGVFMATEIGNWTADIFFFDRQGTVVDTIPNPGFPIYGIAYCGEGRAWLWCQGGTGHPSKAVAFEVDVTRRVFTGIAMIGDSTIAATNPGGIAGGAAYYEKNGVPTMLVLTQANSDTIYEMHGRFQYGRSCGPQIGFSGDAPYAGNSSFAIEWSHAGATNTATIGVLMLGFGSSGLPLGPPFWVSGCELNLGQIVLSVPTTGANCAGTRPLPLPSGVAGGVVYCQWIVVPESGLPAMFSDGGAFLIQP